MTVAASMSGFSIRMRCLLMLTVKQVLTQTQQQQFKDKPLVPGERVLLWNFWRHDQNKLAHRYRASPFVVISQFHPNSPVYKVWLEGQRGPEKTIHHSNLWPRPLRPNENVNESTLRNTEAHNNISGPLFLPLILPPTESVAVQEPAAVVAEE